MLKIEMLKRECTGCGACKTACSTGSIELLLDSEGFYYPHIDNSKCVKCGKCDNICHCLNPISLDVCKTSYYGWHKDENKRANSSSGGVFVALADKIISENGIVYGAAFDYEKRELMHVSSDEVNVEELQKSKYIESNIGETFSKIKKNLSEGRKVLFCGTPCMCAGLRSVIKENNNNLIICDFVCHGVPSAGLFKSHMKSIFGEKEKILGLDFRPKDKCGWTGKDIYVYTKNKKWHRPYMYDSYYKGFLKDNLILRHSCYNCKYRQQHVSDVTIADFWRYREIEPELNDEKGISLIIANNEKGRNVVEKINDVFHYIEIDNKYAEYVYAEKDYSKEYKKREEFFALVEEVGFEDAAKRTYMKNNELKYLKYRIKQMVKKLIGRR